MAREPQADFATGAGGRQRAREPRTERNARGMRESVGRVVSQRCAECSAASGERCQAWGGVLALAFAGVLGGRRTVCRRARYGQHGTAIRGFGGGRTVPETVAAAVNGSRRWSRKKKNGRQSECQERDQAAKALKAGPRDRAKRIGPREGDVSESESETRARRRGEMPWGETREIQLDKESRGISGSREKQILTANSRAMTLRGHRTTVLSRPTSPRSPPRFLPGASFFAMM